MGRFLGDIRNVDFYRYPICRYFWLIYDGSIYLAISNMSIFFTIRNVDFADIRFVDFDDTRCVNFCPYTMTILADIQYADIFADIRYVDIFPIYDMLVFADIRYVNILSISDADTNIFYFTLLGINSKS